MQGRIARVLEMKGFGFIKGEDGVEYFFHRDDLVDSFDDLAHDLRTIRDIDVTFEIAKSNRGPRAANVERIFGEK